MELLLDHQIFVLIHNLFGYVSYHY